MRKKETYDLLLPIVNAIPKTFKPTSITDNADGTYKIFSCNTLWLTKSYKITINSVEYTINDYEPNQWILVSGASLPPLVDFDIYSPFFLHATIMEQSNYMGRVQDSKDKLPLIYLHDIVRERYNNNPELSLDRESDCDIYFLIDSDFKNWTTFDHHKLAITPMRNLLFSFIETLDNYKYVADFDDFEVFNHARFGVYTDRGHEKRMFDDDLSGCQLRINIPFLKNLSCSDDCSA